MKFQKTVLILFKGLTQMTRFWGYLWGSCARADLAITNRGDMKSSRRVTTG